ncbi:ribosome recycling factor [Rothia dentocariosa]|uniref:ribosome recycling factor n=1 Tax=Rothia dentocariosa TaxID=2047 RepID=UPI0028E44C11|nr:ribosome recycling factor [Rothia dentocariosa]
MGFDLKNIVEQGIDKAKNLVNDKAGKEVVNDEHTSKAEEVVNENVQKITDKFGK